MRALRDFLCYIGIHHWHPAREIAPSCKRVAMLCWYYGYAEGTETCCGCRDSR